MTSALCGHNVELVSKNKRQRGKEVVLIGDHSFSNDARQTFFCYMHFVFLVF